MPEYKALLVDFDGTLAESRGPEDELLVELGCKYSNGARVEISDFEKYWGCGAKGLMIRVMKDKNCEKAGSACAEEYFRRFDEILGRSRLINPCTSKIIGAIRTKMKTAIVSSSEKALLDRAAAYFGVDADFDLIVGREEGERAKPEPDVYLKALSKLGVDAREAVAVEDTARGIEAARAAGIGTVYGIKTRWNDWKDLEGADGTIQNLNELLSLFL